MCGFYSKGTSVSLVTTWDDFFQEPYKLWWKISFSGAVWTRNLGTQITSGSKDGRLYLPRSQTLWRYAQGPWRTQTTGSLRHVTHQKTVVLQQYTISKCMQNSKANRYTYNYIYDYILHVSGLIKQWFEQHGCFFRIHPSRFITWCCSHPRIKAKDDPKDGL